MSKMRTYQELMTMIAETSTENEVLKKRIIELERVQAQASEALAISPPRDERRFGERETPDMAAKIERCLQRGRNPALTR